MNLLDLIKARRAVRSYEPRAVEQEKLNYLLECARLAPSATNCQPWRFEIVVEPARLEELKKIYPRDWFKSVPCVIVACGNHAEAWHRSADGKDHTDIDVAIAVEHLCLAAAEQGLGTCWVCNFDVEQCKKLMNLPENIEPIALIPVGYPTETEVKEKQRKPLAEIMIG